MALINSRLALAAELIEKAEVVADIGTDHALLPIYMLNKGIAKRVIACDIAKGPLSVAKENVAKKGVADKVSLRLADGLEGVLPGECDAVTITGMGGETIAGIIDRAPWLKAEKQTLVLQPMSCDDRLRLYLNNNGFSITKERAVFSSGRVYTVIKAVYTGKAPESSPEYIYIGRLLEGGPGSAELSFAEKRLAGMKKCLEEITGVERRKDLYNELSISIPAVERAVKNAVESNLLK